MSVESTETSRTVRLASVRDIPEGQGREFRVGELFVAIFRDKGEFYAIEDMCPHAGAPLNDGPVSNCAVMCLWHGWKFSLKDGTCLNVPRGLPLTLYPVTVDGDDLYVTLPMGGAEK
jgi:nitrite reductase/ring-hydroxylating ferredoxin subunit